MLGLTFSSLAWLNMLAGFVEFNTFDMLAGYPSKVENMLSQLNVQAGSEGIRQFPYCYAVTMTTDHAKQLRSDIRKAW